MAPPTFFVSTGGVSANHSTRSVVGVTLERPWTPQAGPRAARGTLMLPFNAMPRHSCVPTDFRFGIIKPALKCKNDHQIINSVN